MHWSIIFSVGLTSLATSSFATIFPRDDYPYCGSRKNVPLSPNPEHSTYNFTLDPSVQDFINATNPAINTVHLYQNYATRNEGYAPISKFGPQNPYIVSTDRCENGDSRSPDGYYVTLCVGNGTSCAQNSAPAVVCTPYDDQSRGREFCPDMSDPRGNPKAVSLIDTTPWTCRVCTADSYCPPVL
ncbi:hypothetical protein LX36DRAFT_621334 [Colletotrichum falcatum]|nr:hypothetical protein LX36DRAFT_621334 [Colletotrichum falcatum]